MQAKEIEEEIEKRFGKRATSEKRLSYYRREGWIVALMEGRHDLAWLFDKISDFLEVADGRRPAALPSMFLDSQRKTKLMTRDKARSEIFAYLAAKEEKVIEFRKRYLKNKLLDRARVEEFLKSSVASIQPSRLNPPKLPIGWEVRPLFLDYASLQDNWVRCVPAATEMLFELKRVNDFLAQKYGWQEAQATVFNLTGAIPSALGVRTETENKGDRIRLVVDPVVTPRELEKYYRELRRRMDLTRKTKTLTEKHLRLAVIACKREAKAESWKAAFAAWNKAAAKADRYEHESNFRRDVLKARERLIGVTPQ